MTADRSLVLPSPARELWLQSRDAVRASLERIQRHEADYALTGGTVLAARWRHRKSFDIAIFWCPRTRRFTGSPAHDHRDAPNPPDEPRRRRPEVRRVRTEPPLR